MQLVGLGFPGDSLKPNKDGWHSHTSIRVPGFDVKLQNRCFPTTYHPVMFLCFSCCLPGKKKINVTKFCRSENLISQNSWKQILSQHHEYRIIISGWVTKNGWAGRVKWWVGWVEVYHISVSGRVGGVAVGGGTSCFRYHVLAGKTSGTAGDLPLLGRGVAAR
jgi:hypothetical protein